VTTINYNYPTSQEQLRRINAEKIQNLQRPRPTFALFPVTEKKEWRLEWEQRDNWRGLQQLRGLNGEPSYVKLVGLKRYSSEPGVFGEYMTLDEKQMTTRASLYNEGQVVEIGDLVLERQEYLNARETDLLEFLHWCILLNGTFTVLGPTGAEYGATFPIQTATFSDWDALTTGTPLADYLGLKTLARNKSMTFGGGAQSFMNSLTLNNVILNNNPADLGGMRASLGGIARTGTPITTEEANRIFTSQGVPTIVEYDEGYNRESDGAFQVWIPDHVVVIVGRRSNGDPLGEYRMVRNVNNPGNAPGRYTKVIDNLDRDVPRKISVHQGHNGGLALFYPSAIIRANT
jgi:hypothetical protein